MTASMQGLVEEAKLDSFYMPYYAPSTEELRCEIAREGSFAIDHLEPFGPDYNYYGGGEGRAQISGEEWRRW